uniref:Metal ion binding protein n=1 Tax=Solanum tuberosum TaxID=4113 RepID=M1BGF2_SOLTU
MKQRAFIKLFIDRNNRKSRTKAFKIAVSQPGVESAAIKEGEDFQLEVVGDIDAVDLTNCLRKKLGHAQLLSVGPVVVVTDSDNDNDNDNLGGGTGFDANPQPHSYPYFGVPQYQVYEVSDPNPECCSIM